MLDLKHWQEVHAASKAIIAMFTVFILLSIVIPLYLGSNVFECESIRPRLLQISSHKTNTEELHADTDITVLHDLLTSSSNCTHVLILISSRICSVILIILTWREFMRTGGGPTTMKYPMHSFFTIWTLFMLTTYFILITMYHLCRLILHSHMVSVFWDTYRTVVFSLFQSQMTSNFLVTFGFWALTYPLLKEQLQAYMWSWPLLMMHGGTFLLLLVEFYLSDMYVTANMIFVAMGVSFAYVIFSIHNYGILPSLPVDVRRMETAFLMIVIFSIMISCHFMLSKYSRHKRRKKDFDSNFVVTNLPLLSWMICDRPSINMNRKSVFICSHHDIAKHNVNIVIGAFMKEGEHFYLLVKSCHFSERFA